MSVFDEHPLVIDLRARQAAHKERGRIAEEHEKAQWEPYLKQVDEWEAARKDAYEAGKPPPPKPEPPEISNTWRDQHLTDEGRLREEEKRLRRDLAPELLPEVRSRKRDVLNDSRPIVERLAEQHRAFNSLDSEERSLFAATGVQSQSHRMNIGEFASLVERGDDVQPSAPVGSVQAVTEPIRTKGNLATNLHVPVNPFDSVPRTRRRT